MPYERAAIIVQFVVKETLVYLRRVVPPAKRELAARLKRRVDWYRTQIDEMTEKAKATNDGWLSRRLNIVELRVLMAEAKQLYRDFA